MLADNPMCKLNGCSPCLKLIKCVNINWKMYFHWTKEREFCLLISEEACLTHTHTRFHFPVLISPPLSGGFQRIEKGSRGERVSLVSQCICEWSWYTGCDLWESHLRSYSSTPAPHLSLSRSVSFSLSPQMRWDRWDQTTEWGEVVIKYSSWWGKRDRWAWFEVRRLWTERSWGNRGVRDNTKF